MLSGILGFTEFVSIAIVSIRFNLIPYSEQEDQN